MTIIPSVFDLPGAGFVLLPAGKKFPPFEEEWQLPETAHSFKEAADHSAKGNVGLLAGCGGLVGLDQDKPDAFRGVELPLSTTWETRPGRLGMIFCAEEDDLAPVLASLGKKTDLSQFKLYKDGLPVGEIKLQRSYQVIPPSWKVIEKKRVDYRLLDDRPPATISVARLLADLQNAGISVSLRLEQNAARLSELEQKARQKRAETGEQRAYRYAQAALESEVDAVCQASEGTRNSRLNQAAFSLGGFVGAGVLEEGEVERSLLRAAQAAGLSEDEALATIHSGLEAGKNEPREIPASSMPPRATSTPPLGGLEEEDGPTVDEATRGKALEVLTNGDPMGFILDTLAKYHAGDRRSAELLLCSVAIGSILNANGTQPKLSGRSGKGKTHLCKALRHLMPPEWVLYTALSPKALYYDPDIKPGMVIFSDDVRISEDLEDTLKRAMSNFQEPAVYRVVGKNRNLETHYLPERLIWWLTSVADDQEEQLINRFFGLGVNESEEQDLAALDLTFAPLIEGRREFPITEEVLISRQIIRQIKSRVWMVRAPFLKDSNGGLNVVWANPEDRRNPGRFVDLLAAYAVLRSEQRVTREEDGFTLITATVEDFQAAKALYESRAENLTMKLSDGELHFIKWLVGKAKKGIYEFKINDVAREYRGADGGGQSTKALERMLLGRKDRNTYGLIDRIKGGGLTVDLRSDTESMGEGSRKHQVRYKLFTFDPSKFELLGSYGAAVTLKASLFGVDPARPGADPPHGSAPTDPLDNDNIQKIHNISGIDPPGPKEIKSGVVGSEKSSLSLWVGSAGSVPALDSGSFGSVPGSVPGSAPGSAPGSVPSTEPPSPEALAPVLERRGHLAPGGLKPAESARLWSEAAYLLRSMPRRCNGAAGLLPSDLAARSKLDKATVEAILERNGWRTAKIEKSGLKIWIPSEKAATALGVA